MNDFFIHHLTKKDITLFEINFTKFLTKKDKSILLFCKNNLKNKYIEILKNDLIEKKIYDNLDDLNKNIFTDLLKLKDKNIIISYDRNPMTYISIITSFHIDKDIVGISFSPEFLSSFSKESFFNKINLNYILNFKERYTHILYQKFVLTKKEIITFKLDEFKQLFNLSAENYNRFYDLEKNILIPVINDILENSSLNISYEKVRASEHKNSKILEIKFICHNISNEKNIINSFINKIKNKIQNIDYIYNLLSNILPIQGAEYIEERINYALETNPKNFEAFLIKIFSIENYKKEITIFNHTKYFSSLFELHSFLLKVIKELNNKGISINFEVLSVKFLSKIFLLQDDQNLQYQGRNYSFYLKYKKNGESNITIKQRIETK